MNKTRFIQFRVTRDQFERILNNARAKGFVNVSAFLRDLALNRSMITERKIDEIYEAVVRGKKQNQSGGDNDIEY